MRADNLSHLWKKIVLSGARACDEPASDEGNESAEDHDIHSEGFEGDSEKGGW